jgi:hypothetical protein
MYSVRIALSSCCIEIVGILCTWRDVRSCRGTSTCTTYRRYVWFVVSACRAARRTYYVVGSGRYGVGVICIHYAPTRLRAHSKPTVQGIKFLVSPQMCMYVHASHWAVSLSGQVVDYVSVCRHPASSVECPCPYIDASAPRTDDTFGSVECPWSERSQCKVLLSCLSITSFLRFKM